MQLFLQTLASGITLGAVYALIAVGFSLSLGSLRVVDFAYGAYVVTGAFAAYWASTSLFTDGSTLSAALCVLFGVAVVSGLAVFFWGVLLFRLLESTHMAQLVGTMGVTVVISGTILTLFGTNVVLASFPPAQAVLQIGPVYVSTGRIVGGIIGLGALLVLAYALATRMGLMIQATAMDPKGASLIGINIARARIVTVVIGAGLGGLAGSLLVIFLPIAPSDYTKFLLIAFFTTAVGGLGSLRGAMLAAFLIALLEIFSQTYAPNLIKNAIPYVVVALFIILLPQGLGNARKGGH